MATRARSPTSSRTRATRTCWSARRAAAGSAPLAIDPAKQGGWRVEEEFVNAIRGNEPVTHTDFVTGTKYMEWTDAVAESLRTRCEVKLPLLSV